MLLKQWQLIPFIMVFSTNKEVAERKAKELSKQVHRHCWVTEYTLDKDNWSDFEND